MKILILALFYSATAFSQQGAVFNYLKLNPISLPSTCSAGVLRTNSSNNILEQCNATNNWYPIGSVQPTTSVTTNYQILNSDYFLDVTTSSARTVNLPPPKAGRIVIVKDVTGGAASYTLTIDPYASEQIDGVSSKTITTAYGSSAFYSDGTNWFSFGGGGGVTASSTPTASTISEWDANANMSGNNLIAGYATTATAGSSTTLTVSSAAQQYFTGTSNQTVVLPVASTLTNGMQWTISNLSTGGVTINSSGGNNLAVLPASFQSTVTVINSSGGTGTASWNWNIVPVQSGGSTSSSVYAQVYFSNAAAEWSFSGSSFVDPTLIAGTNAITVRQSRGLTVTAASSSLCGITFTPASSSSVYTITANYSVYGLGLAGVFAYQLIDNNSTVISSNAGFEQQNGSGASADVFVPGILSGIYAPGTTSPVTVKIQGLSTNGGTGYIEGVTAASTSVAVEWTITQINPPVTTNGATFGAGLTVTGNTFLGQAAGNTVSIGYPASTGVHQMNGGLKVTTNAKTGSYTLDTSITDFIVSSNDSGGAPTYTLPAVSNGRIVAIKDTAGNAATEQITISPASGLIDGLSSLVMAGPYSSALLYSDGTNWYNLNRGETVSARYHGYTSGGVGVSGSFSNVLYTTKDWDSSAAYSSGIYTCPDTGHYRITASLYPTAATITAATAYNFQVVLAGSAYAAREEWFATAATKPINPQVTTLFLCTSGQTVTVQGSYASSETTPSVTASNIYNFIEIWKEGP
jgi:hypothetical protein